MKKGLFINMSIITVLGLLNLIIYALEPKIFSSLLILVCVMMFGSRQTFIEKEQKIKGFERTLLYVIVTLNYVALIISVYAMIQEIKALTNWAMFIQMALYIFTAFLYITLLLTDGKES